MKVFSVFAIGLLASCISEEPTEPGEAATADEDAREAGEPAENAIEIPKLELAQLVLPAGDLTFYSIPAIDSIGVREVSRPGRDGALTEVSGDRSPLAVYLAYTAASTPVPRALVEFSDDTELRARAMARGMVESLPAPIAAVDVQVDALYSPTSNAEQCAEGVTSPSFAAEVCTMTNWEIDFCHNGTWYSVTDEVGWSNRKRDSLSRTLACYANGRVRHQYKFGGVWYEPIDEAIPSGERWRWEIDGNSALARKIIHSRTASGFVRGSSHFNVSF